MSRELERKAKDPSTVSLAYEAMVPSWNKMSALLGGTEAMRAAGREYLPQHSAEKDTVYNERLSRNVLFNVTELTLDSWVGRPFSESVKPSETMDPQILPLLEDIDLQGNNLTVFARSWFRCGLANSFSHVLVDFPRVMPREDGQPRTLDDDRKENLRPYWVHLPPHNVIFIGTTIVNGAEKLTQVRIMETFTEQFGFAEIVKRQIRVLEPGLVSIYTEQKISGKIQWVLSDQWSTSIDFIPLVTFYSNKGGTMIGKSPLLDLADLNIAHWQSQSDQTAIMTVTRFPMMAVAGGSDDSKLEIGPNKWLFTEDPSGRYYYVEHSGKAIGAGRQDLLDLESKMAEYGAEFLKKRPGNLTATARALDSAEATSPLQDVSRRFIDSMNLAIQYTAQWMKIEAEKAGTVSLVTEFGPEAAESADLDALNAARKNRDISRETYLAELKRRGVLSESFDAEEDKHEIEEEQTAFAGAAGLNLDVTQGEDDDGEVDDGTNTED